jgi:hypothetical protein
MALFLGTLLAYRSPTLTGAILGVATAATYFPMFVLPIWLSFYRGHGMGRFLTAFLLAVAACLVTVGMALSLQGELESNIRNGLQSPAWQPWWRIPSTMEGFWSPAYGVYRIPVFLLFMAFVITTMFWPSPKNLAHVIALCTAVFVGLQWWCADQGGSYVLWYVPLLLLLVFRPNLHDRVAPTIETETDWLSRSLGWSGRLFRRLVKLPEPAEKNPV